MNAWSGDPRAGAVFYTAGERSRGGKGRASSSRSSNAATVISLGDLGGQRGPALDSVAVRLTQDQLIRQVIQGGGNMPAYGKRI